MRLVVQYHAVARSINSRNLHSFVGSTKANSHIMSGVVGLVYFFENT